MKYDNRKDNKKQNIVCTKYVTVNMLLHNFQI